MDLISVTRKGELSVDVRVRGHAFASDLSVSDGGGDAGPSPAELLAGSLGACIAMMVQGYCNRHGYEGDTGVSLTLELASEPKRIGRIVADIELPEGVPEDKFEAVRKVAERCPIHQTLVHPPALDIDIV